MITDFDYIYLYRIWAIEIILFCLYLVCAFLFNSAPAASGSPPTFIQKPSIKQDADGKRLCFECKIKSESEPAIRWFKDDVEVIDKGRHLIYCDKLPDNAYFACLEIDDINGADAGKYRVNVKNNSGEINGLITLNLDGK